MQGQASQLSSAAARIRATWLRMTALTRLEPALQRASPLKLALDGGCLQLCKCAAARMADAAHPWPMGLVAWGGPQHMASGQSTLTLTEN